MSRPKRDNFFGGSRPMHIKTREMDRVPCPDCQMRMLVRWPLEVTLAAAVVAFCFAICPGDLQKLTCLTSKGTSGGRWSVRGRIIRRGRSDANLWNVRHCRRRAYCLSIQSAGWCACRNPTNVCGGFRQRPKVYFTACVCVVVWLWWAV